MVLPTINGELNFLRKLVTIDGSMVTTESGIPLGLNVNLPGVDLTGKDVRLAKLDGTPIAREIECVGVPNAEDVMIWYPFDTIASTDSQFWVYWGNTTLSEPASDSTYGSEAVWDNNYLGVWHMNSVTSFIDSTSNDNDGTVHGAPTLINGSYGKSISFVSGSSQYIDVGDIDTGNTTLTYIASIDDTTPAAIQGIITKYYPDAGGLSWLNWIGLDGKIRCIGYDGGVSNVYSKTLNSGVEYIHTFIIDENDNIKFKTDSDATIVGDVISSLTQINTTILIGAYRLANTTPTKFLDGDINEVRLSDIVRSDNYLTTTHTNLNNPTATGVSPFYTSFGTPQHQRRTPQFM